MLQTAERHISNFPKEMIEAISFFLDKKSLYQLRLVSKFFEYATLNPFVKTLNIPILTASIHNHSFIITSQKNLYAWGENKSGQLGLNSLETCNNFKKVPFLDGVMRVTTQDSHTFALTEDRKLYCWGDHIVDSNFYGYRLLNATYIRLQNVTHIISESTHAFFTKEGKTFALGANSSGQLGLGDTKYCFNSREIALKGIASIVTQKSHSMALTHEGKVYTWGENGCGQLGLRHNNNCDTPQEVLLKSKATYIAIGLDFTFAVLEGALYAWGYNFFGQLGLGHNKNCNSPQEVSLKDVTCLYPSINHTFALTKQGEVYAWGSNENGKLGLGHNTDCYIPQKIALENVVSIIAKNTHSFALTKKGNVYAWGANDNEQLGFVHKIDCYSPQKVPVKRIESISAGDYHAVALSKDGKVYTWGRGFFSHGPHQILDFDCQALDSLGQKECMKRLPNTQFSPKARQACIEQLETFIKANSYPTLLNKLFNSDTKQAIKIARGLKDHISLKKSITLSSFEHEMEIYNKLIKNLGQQVKNRLDICMNKLQAVLEREKQRLKENMKAEYISICKKG